MQTKTINRIHALCGDFGVLARRLDVSPQAVNKWFLKKEIPVRSRNKHGERVNWVLEIERVLNGAVTRYEMAPDIYPYDK